MKDARRQNRIAIVVVVLVTILSAVYYLVEIVKAGRAREAVSAPVGQVEPGEKTCTRDEDCAPSRSCTFCGQCFSREPRLETDCKMYCLNVPSCACVNGACMALPDGGR